MHASEHVVIRRRSGKTHRVAADPGAEPGRPDSVGENDINWPIPEIAMWPLASALIALMVWAFGFDWVLVPIVPLMVVLAAITVIDLRELRVPDLLTRPATVLAVPLLALATLTDWADVSLLRALFGALAMGGLYFAMWFIYPKGMGFGDVKLAVILGAQLGFFGWIVLFRGIIAAHFVSAPAAILLLIFAKAKRDTGFPFGPFLVAGTVIALVMEARGL